MYQMYKCKTQVAVTRITRQQLQFVLQIVHLLSHAVDNKTTGPKQSHVKYKSHASFLHFSDLQQLSLEQIIIIFANRGMSIRYKQTDSSVPAHVGQNSTQTAPVRCSFVWPNSLRQSQEVCTYKLLSVQRIEHAALGRPRRSKQKMREC